MNNATRSIDRLDDDNPEWTPQDFDRARPASEMLPAAAVGKLTRGVQIAPVKRQVTLRLDPDVLDKFRATGRGWQSRINAALRAAEV